MATKAAKPKTTTKTDREERQAAHEAAQAALVAGTPKPETYSDDDTSIDARMARLHADHVRMGAREP